MELFSLTPMRTGSLTWQPRAGAHAMTVVCKATFELRPVECVLAASQEPLYDADRHERDDANKRVLCPADLVPAKARCDVTLVGHAFAPGGEAVRRLTARVVIGLVDKEIEARGDRDGGRLSRESLESFGVGPLPVSSPARLLRLRVQSAETAERWRDDPLPSDFDFGFFNVAPADQQVATLRDNERLILHGLHREHARLVTALPGLRPRAIVQRGDGSTLELAMKPDSLWLDTDRGLCTLAWRAHFELARPDEPGRVVVAESRRGDRLSLEEVLRLAGPLDLVDETVSIASDARPPSPVSPPSPRESEPGPRAVESPRTTTSRRRVTTLVAVPTAPSSPRDASPPWLSSSPLSVSPHASSIPPPPPSPPGSMAFPPRPPMMTSAGAIEQASANPVGVLAASNAAAASAPEPRRRADTLPRLVVADEPAHAPPRVEPLELLWVDTACGSALRARYEPGAGAVDEEPSSELSRLEACVTRVLATEPALDTSGVERAMLGAVGADHRFRAPLVMLAGELRLPFDEVEVLRATVAAATPLASGDKRLREALDAVRDVIDKSITTGSAGGPSIVVTAQLAESLTQRVRDAFAHGDRILPPGYLASATDRVLLDQRRYQRRVLLGQTWLRALLSPRSGHVGGHAPQTPGEALVLYLPEALATSLPMLPSFRARVLAEARPSQDYSEASPIALRAVALARGLSLTFGR